MAGAITPRLVTLDEAGLEGELYLPRGRERFELCVIALGGSGGGLMHRDAAAALAQHGVAALALAYFGYGKLPPKLERIPLEYFEHAARWLGTTPELRGARLVLMGASRGAELSLKLAASYRVFEGVIATSPSYVLWPGVNTRNPAWTQGGRDLPVVEYKSERPPDPQIEQVDGKGYLISRDQFHFLLERNPTVEAAIIPIERITGPVLLFAGKDDLLWPSSFFADQIERRAASHGFRFPLANVQYEGVGHVFPAPGQPEILRVPPPKQLISLVGMALGGRADAVAAAAEDRWRRILAFIEAAAR